jgi:hypothetical protein
MRVLKQLFLALFFAGLVFLALFKGSQGASNLISFWVSLTVVGSCFLFSDDYRRDLRDKAPPQWVRACNTALHVLYVCLFAWFGWAWTAIAIAFIGMASAYAYSPISATKKVTP